MAEINTRDSSLSNLSRQLIDIHSWSSNATHNWNQLAADCHIRIDQIFPADNLRIWTSASCLNRIIGRFLTEAIEASMAGDRIEVEYRLADESGEWLTIIVRDWSGGRPENWTLNPSIQQLAKLMEGYIDIANHPGRGTICSLHLPTGKLQGWLRRQIGSMSCYHVTWNTERDSKNMALDARMAIDEAVQMSLISQGSFIPLGANGYLCASNQPLETHPLDVSIARYRLKFTEDECGVVSSSVMHCGTIREFVDRIDKSLEKVAKESNTNPEYQHTKPHTNHRFDPPEDELESPTELRQRPAILGPIQKRIRPRRSQKIV